FLRRLCGRDERRVLGGGDGVVRCRCLRTERQSESDEGNGECQTLHVISCCSSQCCSDAVLFQVSGRVVLKLTAASALSAWSMARKSLRSRANMCPRSGVRQRAERSEPPATKPLPG